MPAFVNRSPSPAGADVRFGGTRARSRSASSAAEPIRAASDTARAVGLCDVQPVEQRDVQVEVEVLRTRFTLHGDGFGAGELAQACEAPPRMSPPC